MEGLRKRATRTNSGLQLERSDSYDARMSRSGSQMKQEASLGSAASASAPVARNGSRVDEPPLERHWHRSENSLLSSASNFKNYRGLFNLCILILVLGNLRMAVENVIKYGVLVNPLAWFSWWLERPYSWPNVLLLLSLNVYILAAIYIERALARKQITADIGLLLHCTNMFLELAIPIIAIYVFHPNPAGSVLVVGHAAIVWMKLVSYVMVNKWCRDARDTMVGGETSYALQMKHRIQKEMEMLENQRVQLEKKEMEQNNLNESSPVAEHPHHSSHRSSVDALPFIFDPIVSYPDNLTIKDMYYFLFAPTLCYELNYPRTPRIRKRFLLRRLMEAIFFPILLFALGEQWVVPIVRNSMKPLQQLDGSMVLERILKLAIPNHFLWLIFFYWYFQCVLNLVAELLRFADRQFYRDWWNASTIQFFWRNWNIPVHKWCSRHLYFPVLRLGYSRETAWIAVFLLSAFLHEVLVSVPLGMFKIWSFAAMMGQIPLAIITERFFKGTHYGNIIVWLSLVLGQPIAILMYVHDYLVVNNMIKI